MTFVKKRLNWIDFANLDLWVTFLLNKWYEDDYDVITAFEETEDMYRFKIYDWYEISKSEVKDYRFHEIGIECWECDWYCRLSEKVKGDWTHDKWKSSEFNRSWDFCSQECLDKYVKNPENDFTLK